RSVAAALRRRTARGDGGLHDPAAPGPTGGIAVAPGGGGVAPRDARDRGMAPGGDGRPRSRSAGPGRTRRGTGGVDHPGSFRVSAGGAVGGVSAYRLRLINSADPRHWPDW